MGAAIESVRAERYSWWRALRASSLSPTARHVALTIATYMDAVGGGAWPSMATLADDTGRSRRTVARAVQELEEHGYLEVQSGGGRLVDGRYQHNRYVARMPADYLLPNGDTDGNGDTHDRAPSDGGTVTPQHGAVSPQHGAVSPMTGNGVTHGTRSTQEVPTEEPKEVPSPHLDPFELGRRFAAHVASGQMTRQQAVRAAEHVDTHEDRRRFLEGLDSATREHAA